MKVNAIFGPPGTGKTTELLNLSRGKRALFLSFTKAAALEVRSRLGDDGNGITASTLHSLAFNCLNISKSQVVDKKRMAEFAKETGIPFKGSEEGSDELQEGDEYSAVLSFSNNRMIPRIEAYEHFGCPGTRHKFLMFIDSYEKWKSTFGYVDFDDMLMRWKRSTISLDYEYIFLDEAQDCSPLQWSVFRSVVRPDCNVVIAGDDDQAIYEWNGADPHGMIDFLQATEGEMRVLSQSHRIPNSVHKLVHKTILPQISKRVDKVYNPRDERGMVNRYGDFHDINHRNLAESPTLILVRDRWKMDEVKKTLNREMIPYSIMGGSSPWTSRIANQLRNGEEVVWDSSNMHWREFYRQADLRAPVNVTLSTIHQAKGRESPRVVLDLGLPARTLVSMYNDRDAELRVMYVAMTRASRELILCGENPLL